MPIAINIDAIITHISHIAIIFSLLPLLLLWLIIDVIIG